MKNYTLSVILSAALLLLSGCGSTTNDSKVASTQELSQNNATDKSNNFISNQNSASAEFGTTQTDNSSSYIVAINPPVVTLSSPQSPSNLKASKVSDTQVTLKWKDNSNNETSYEVYVNNKLRKNLPSDTNCISIKQLKDNSNYTFKVVAKNRAGTSISNTLSIKTLVTDKFPSITLVGDDIELIIGDNYIDTGAVATDPEDGNLSVTADSNVDTTKSGNYRTIYSAKDKAGHSVQTLRNVKVILASELNMKKNIPYDSNLELGEEGILYYADPRIEENGKNRALKIDYLNMTFTNLNVYGINPHSIDRAGDSNKFYIRTQNSTSFDVVNFEQNSVKTVDLKGHTPRAIGATNLKYNIQLLSVKYSPLIDVIDTTTDEVIATLGDDESVYNKTTSGHAFWLDEDNLGLIDRVNTRVIVYKVIDNGGVLSFEKRSTLTSDTTFHAVERVANPKTRDDLVTFYAMAEGDVNSGILPYAQELKFDPESGILKAGRKSILSESTTTVHGVSPITHHSGISPDGKFLYVPVLDGKVYIIDRSSMTLVKTLDAKLGAAHVEFSKLTNVAIITNHYSNDVTIIDLNTQSVKKNINIGVGQEYHEDNKHLLQPHFSYISPDGRYFYTFATQDGDFIKIDLSTLEVIERLHTGGAPEQAHS